MARGSLFEYAVLWHPKEKKDAAGNPMESKKSVLVTELTSVVAVSKEEVGIIVARSLPPEYMDKLDEVEIIIRPF